MPYRPHYKACPSEAYHRMTPRIERILALLDDREGYRVLRSSHINEFVKYYFNESYNNQTTARCLRWMMDEGLVLRIRRDPDSKTVAQGSLAKIYSSNSSKNQALNERQGKPSLIVPHDLQIADSIVWGILHPCRLSQGAMRFIDAPAILESRGSNEAKASAKPYTWPVQVVYRDKMYKCTITPDRFFGTYFTALAHNWWFLLEQDRGTEPQQRSDYAFNSGTSLFRRFLTYAFLYHTQVLFHLYNIKGFRILFVTSSQERIKHALEIWRLANEALKEFQKQSNLEIRGVPNNVLHCIDRPTLRAGDIFTVPWVNGRGDRVTIDPPLAAPQLSIVG